MKIHHEIQDIANEINITSNVLRVHIYPDIPQDKFDQFFIEGDKSDLFTKHGIKKEKASLRFIIEYLPYRLKTGHFSGIYTVAEAPPLMRSDSARRDLLLFHNLKQPYSTHKDLYWEGSQTGRFVEWIFSFNNIIGLESH